eukprot:s853_g5.t1
MVKLSVEEFLAGHWLNAEAIFRGQLLGQVVTHPDVIEDWPALLSACCGEPCCQEAVLEAIRRSCPGAVEWAEGCVKDRSLPLPFRLRLCARLNLESLVPEAEAALLQGHSVPLEAMQWMEATKLWPQLVSQRLVVPAAALLDAHPDSCEDSEEVTSLISDSLMRSSAEAKLALHRSAASLALRHSDRRVAALLPQLGAAVRLPEVMEAAARGEPWTLPWWPAAVTSKLQGTVEELQQLMKVRPWSSISLLDALISAWLDVFDRPEMPPSEVAEALRALRLELPKRARSLAKALLEMEAKEAKGRWSFQWADSWGRRNAPVPGLEALASSCSRRKLKELLEVLPCECHSYYTVPSGLARDASTALWALKNVSNATVEPADGGFQLLLGNEQRCGFICWADARRACLEDASLAAAYPREVHSNGWVVGVVGMAQAGRSVRFQEEEEIHVVNTFLQVGKSQRMAWRKHSSHSAPAAVLSQENQPQPAAAKSDEDDESSEELPVTSWRTYDSFDDGDRSTEDLKDLGEEGEEDGPMMDKVETFDPFEDGAQQGPTPSMKLTPPEAPAAPAAPAPAAPGYAPQEQFPRMMCVQAFPVQVMCPVPGVSPVATPTCSPHISPRVPARPDQPVLLGRTGADSLAPLECISLPNGKEFVRWKVDARKLESQEKQILSPEFELQLPGLGSKPFRIMILAKETKGKGGRGFIKAGGKGRLFVKCETSSLTQARPISFRVSVGPNVVESKGPLRHLFTDQPCCPLQESNEDWDLQPAVDKASKRFEAPKLSVGDHHPLGIPVFNQLLNVFHGMTGNAGSFRACVRPRRETLRFNIPDGFPE